MHQRHGIIPRVEREIWNRIVHGSSNYEFELKVSFLEIYNEEIYDLLSKDGYVNNRNNKKSRRKNKTTEKLTIGKFSDQVFAENLNGIYVRDQNELFDLVKSTNKYCRSHAVLTIILVKNLGGSEKVYICILSQIILAHMCII